VIEMSDEYKRKH